MRYVAIFLFSLSVMAVDELPVTASVPAGESVVIQLPGFNTGRGDGSYNIRPRLVRNSVPFVNETILPVLVQVDSGDFQRLQAGVVVETFAPFDEPQRTNFIAANGALQKPLIFDNCSLRVTIGPGVGSFVFFPHTLAAGVNQVLSATYTAPAGFVGSVLIVLEYRDNADVVFTKINVLVTITNHKPVVSVSGSPTLLAPGDSTSFLATAIDADGQALAYSWDFGDGSAGSGADVSHAYAAAGTYLATVTVNDGFDSVSASTSIVVAGVDRLPVPRILTSDVVAFVGLPISFDATASTDPQNALAAYQWSFGDGSPAAVNAVISKIYNAIGIYTVALTVTDGEGLRQTLTRQIEVLAQEDAATFGGEVRISSTYFPTKTGRDTLNIFARVNLGDVAIAEGSTLALTYAGKRFEAQLDKRLRAPGWTVKANLRRLPVGTVEINLRARRESVSAEFDSVGAEDEALLDVPLRIEAGGKILQIPVETEFEVNALRTRGKATGGVN